MKIFRAPEKIEIGTSVFLAGSIEEGKAENWQQRMEIELSDSDCFVYNPRREDWDDSWVQSKDNPQFREQVEWELNALESSTMIAMYFSPETKSPISLLELGLNARFRKMIVCCPDGFYRKGNVDIVCAKYNIEQVDTLGDLVRRIKEKIVAENNWKKTKRGLYGMGPIRS